MDARRTLVEVLRLHAPNELADLPMHFWSSWSTWLRPPTPKPLESCTMPGHHGLRFDDDQRFRPAIPQLAEHHPEQPFEAAASA